MCIQKRCGNFFATLSSKTSAGAGRVVDSGEHRQSLQLRILAVKASFDRNGVVLHFTEGMTRVKEVTSL